MLRSNNELIETKVVYILLGLILLISFAACSKSPTDTKSSKKSDSKFDPMALAISDPELQKGRDVWVQTCTTCHATGLTGAPLIGDKDAWKPRIEKGLETLFEHALNGYIGPTYSEMPPKGGFSELSDDEVISAVRFMTFASK